MYLHQTRHPVFLRPLLKQNQLPSKHVAAHVVYTRLNGTELPVLDSLHTRR